MLDSFEIAGLSGSHICLVHKPLLMSLQSFQFLLEERTLPMQLFKAAVYDVLLALDYLHSEADMIHTGNCHPVMRCFTDVQCRYTSK